MARRSGRRRSAQRTSSLRPGLRTGRTPTTGTGTGPGRTPHEACPGFLPTQPQTQKRDDRRPACESRTEPSARAPAAVVSPETSVASPSPPATTEPNESVRVSVSCPKPVPRRRASNLIPAIRSGVGARRRPSGWALGVRNQCSSRATLMAARRCRPPRSTVPLHSRRGRPGRQTVSRHRRLPIGTITAVERAPLLDVPRVLQPR